MDADGGWMARIDFSGAEATAFGTTPEEAVKALVGAWAAYCDDVEGDPGLVAEFREEVVLVRFAVGHGYVKGGHDARWFKGALDCRDGRFDDAFGAASVDSRPR